MAEFLRLTGEQLAARLRYDTEASVRRQPERLSWTSLPFASLWTNDVPPPSRSSGNGNGTGAVDPTRRPPARRASTGGWRRGVRTEETKQRDEAVAQALADGMLSRRELERITGLTQGDLSRALPRLKAAGRVVKEGVQGRHVWRLVQDSGQKLPVHR
jgi:hypothetical protein